MDKRVSRYMAKLGRKGAKVRSERMTPSRRQELGRLAANTRWGKYRLEVKLIRDMTPEELAETERVWSVPWEGGPVASPVRVEVPVGEAGTAQEQW
jgi:hypothetical protein